MLSNREISQNFEVQISTLYNWRKTKPKLYRYLQNADYNFEQSKEINILLKRLAQEIEGRLTVEEIRFFLESKFEAKSLDEIEQMHRILLRQHRKELENDLLFDLYDKISAMKLIEKYIFYKRVYNLRQEQKEIDKSLIRDYFHEFLTREDS